MFDNLKEKVNYEFERYFVYLDLISRADFKQKAFEIAAKQAIYNKILSEIDNMTSEDIKLLMVIEDLVDVMYQKAYSKGLIVLGAHGELNDNAWKQIFTMIKL